MLARRRLWVAVLLVVLAVLAWWPAPQALAIEQTKAGMARALGAYAVARGLNAAISVAKGTEVSVQAGLGASIAVGQVLDPVDDLVEQFSSLMQWVLVAFGAQTLLAYIGAHWLPSLLFTATALALAAILWRGASVPAWLIRAVVVLAFVRFSVPVVALAGETTHRLLLDDLFVTAKFDLERTSAAVGQADAGGNEAAGAGPTASTQDSWWSRWAPAWVRNAEVPSIPKFSSVGRNVEKGIDRMIELSALFLFEAILMPLLFLWGLLFTCRATLGSMATGVRGPV